MSSRHWTLYPQQTWQVTRKTPTSISRLGVKYDMMYLKVNYFVSCTFISGFLQVEIQLLRVEIQPLLLFSMRLFGWNSRKVIILTSSNNHAVNNNMYYRCTMPYCLPTRFEYCVNALSATWWWDEVILPAVAVVTMPLVSLYLLLGAGICVFVCI